MAKKGMSVIKVSEEAVKRGLDIMNKIENILKSLLSENSKMVKYIKTRLTMLRIKVENRRISKEKPKLLQNSKPHIACGSNGKLPQPVS